MEYLLKWLAKKKSLRSLINRYCATREHHVELHHKVKPVLPWWIKTMFSLNLTVNYGKLCWHFTTNDAFNEKWNFVFHLYQTYYVSQVLKLSQKLILFPFSNVFVKWSGKIIFKWNMKNQKLSVVSSEKEKYGRELRILVKISFDICFSKRKNEIYMLVLLFRISLFLVESFTKLKILYTNFEVREEACLQTKMFHGVQRNFKITC